MNTAPNDSTWPADRGWKRDSSSGHNAGWEVDKVTGRDDVVWLGSETGTQKE